MTTTPIFDALYRAHRSAGMAYPGEVEAAPRHATADPPAVEQPPEITRTPCTPEEWFGRPYLRPPPEEHGRPEGGDGDG